MFGRSMFRELDEDPFFSAHMNQMGQMDRMFQDPFARFGRDPMLGITGDPTTDDPHNMRRGGHGAGTAGREVSPFGMFGGHNMFGGMFQGMNSMMDQMHRQFEHVQNDPNAACYSQRSVYSYSNTGEGQPRTFQATTETRKAPGGVKETRRSVRDSESGLERMAIGHHINDRAHILERSRNKKTGEQEEKQDFVNLDESDATGFDQEWQQRTQSRLYSKAELRDRSGRPMRQQALPEAGRRHKDRSKHDRRKYEDTEVSGKKL